MKYLSKWDRRFMKIAEEVASWSKDPSTKTGSVLISPDRKDIIVGYNGFASKMKDSVKLYNNREVKYSRIIHCEVNALILAKRSVEGYFLYNFPLLSCDRCAVQMIQAGIVRTVCPMPTKDQLSRWGTAFKKSLSYFKEAGVEVVQYNKDFSIS